MIIYLSQHPDNRETGTAIWQLFKSSSSKLQSKRDRFLFPTSGISQPSPLSCNYNRRNISDTQVNGMAHQASPNCSSLQDSWSKWELWNWVPRDAPLRVNHCTLPPVYLHIDHCTLPSVSLHIDHCARIATSIIVHYYQYLANQIEYWSLPKAQGTLQDLW